MKVNKKQLETLVLESLMKEISPNMTTKEISLSEGVDTGNPYDLNNPSNLDEFYRKAAEAWTVYCGQSANDAGISNDNRVILYNLLESGEFAEKMNQIWSPNGLNVNKDGSDYYTNNPEDMEAHLEKMGYSKGDYTLSPGVASQGRFEQPYNNPETREGRMPLNESEIRKIIRRALK